MKKVKKTKRGNLMNLVGDNFDKSLNYIKESKNYIYFITSIFIIGGILGFIFHNNLTAFDQILKNIVLKTEGLNGLELILYIFNNNVSVSFFALLFGFILGIIPVFYSLVNGLVLGYVFSKLYAVSGLSEFWRILPHGVFELPAVIFSLSLGLKLGLFLFSRKPIIELKRRFIEGIRTFIFIVVPLLVIAAIIEGLLIVVLK